MKNECNKKKSCFYENQINGLEAFYESKPQTLFGLVVSERGL